MAHLRNGYARESNPQSTSWFNCNRGYRRRPTRAVRLPPQIPTSDPARCLPAGPSLHPARGSPECSRFRPSLVGVGAVRLLLSAPPASARTFHRDGIAASPYGRPHLGFLHNGQSSPTATRAGWCEAGRHRSPADHPADRLSERTTETLVVALRRGRRPWPSSRDNHSFWSSTPTSGSSS